MLEIWSPRHGHPTHLLASFPASRPFHTQTSGSRSTWGNSVFRQWGDRKAHRPVIAAVASCARVSRHGSAASLAQLFGTFPPTSPDSLAAPPCSMSHQPLAPHVQSALGALWGGAELDVVLFNEWRTRRSYFDAPPTTMVCRCRYYWGISGKRSTTQKSRKYKVKE